jgi:hypothetical protein
VTGATGPAGINGANGTNGINGANGTNGEKGATGPPGANGTNGICEACGLTGRAGPTGPTGPPGANGTNGEKGTTGERGPTGPPFAESNGIATNFGNYTGAGSTGGLASGKQESGTWAATIHAPAGTEQAQAEGVVSFPIPLKHLEKVKLNYRNEAEAQMAISPCGGSVAEPVIVMVGNFCAYRGGGFGSKEKGVLVGNVDRNVQGLTGCGTAEVPVACTGAEVAPKFQASNGENMLTETGEGDAGDIGLVLVFRTTEFSQETSVALAAGQEGNMNAIGSWAVAAK